MNANAVMFAACTLAMACSAKDRTSDSGGTNGTGGSSADAGTEPCEGFDDHDACTTDTCGGTTAVHTPVPVDDGNQCTTDACDSATGEVSHEPFAEDDGDICTWDTCDPANGMKHEAKSSEAYCTHCTESESSFAKNATETTYPNPGCPNGVQYVCTCTGGT